MSTIKDVAAEANVSIATVSRVLNKTQYVSSETSDKVLSAVKKVGYRPNAIAKSLKTNKTYMVGLVVPDIANPYFVEIARGVEKIISPYGYTLAVCSTEEDEEKEIKLLSALNEKRVDFVILATCQSKVEPINDLLEQGLELMLIDTVLPELNVDYVVEDNENASHLITDYGVRMGHSKIGIVNGYMNVSTATDRYDGFRSALEENGIEFDSRYCVEGDYTREAAYSSVRRMLLNNMDDLPTLIYSTNNLMTEGAMIAIRELGFKIPEDISLMSFGDITLPQLIEPRLTVVEQNARMMGEKAGHILIERLENCKKFRSEKCYDNTY